MTVLLVAGLDCLMCCESGLDCLMFGKSGLDCLMFGESGLDCLICGESGLDGLICGEPGLDCRICGESGRTRSPVGDHAGRIRFFSKLKNGSSQGQNLDLTVLCVANWLESGRVRLTPPTTRDNGAAQGGKGRQTHPLSYTLYLGRDVPGRRWGTTRAG